MGSSSVPMSSVFMKTDPSSLFFGQIDNTRKFCSSSSIPEISHSQLVEVLKSKTAVVIDVRNPEELVKFGEIPGAINIPLGDLESALSMRPKKLEQLFGITIDERTPLVFSCMAGIRSKKAMAIASRAGYSHVSDFGGGWIEWAKNGDK